MNVYFRKWLSVVSLVLVFVGTTCGTFLLICSISEERELGGMLYSSNALFRKVGDDSALYSSVSLSSKKRRAVLMLSRSPSSLEQFNNEIVSLKQFEETLPAGNYLFLIDDTGKIFLKRVIPKTRKVFDLAEEIRVLLLRLKSVPVFGFFPNGEGGVPVQHLWEGCSELPELRSEGALL